MAAAVDDEVAGILVAVFGRYDGAVDDVAAGLGKNDWYEGFALAVVVVVVAGTVPLGEMTEDGAEVAGKAVDTVKPFGEVAAVVTVDCLARN